MKKSWLIPMIGFLGCNGSDEVAEDMDLSMGAPVRESRGSFSKKVVQPTYSAVAGRRVAVDSSFLLPKPQVNSRKDVFSLLEDEKTIYQEIKVDELYHKVGGFLDLVTVPEVKVEERNRKIVPVPFNRLVGSITANGIMALVEMKDKKVVEVRPGEIVEGWKLKYLDSDKLEFEYIGEGMPKMVTVTSKPLEASVGSYEPQEKKVDFGNFQNKEDRIKKIKNKISDINIREDLDEF